MPTVTQFEFFNLSTFRLERDHAHRWQRELRRVLLVVAGNVFRRDAAVVSLVAARVDVRVAVQQLAPLARARQADAVIVPLHRRKIHDDGNLIFPVRRLAQK